MKAKPTSNSVLMIIGAFVALLLVVAVVLAIQPPKTFDPLTPEGTVQGYYEAVLDEDYELAFTFLTEEARDSCELDFWYLRRDEDVRIVIVGSEIADERAELDVTIEVFYGEGPFNGGSYSEDETVRLELRGDLWLISEPTWPMDRFACEKNEG